MRKLVTLVATLICTGPAMADGTGLTDRAAVSGTQPAPCASQIKYYADGKPRSCQVSSAFLVGDIQIPAGSNISLRQNGEVDIAWLGRETAIYGQALPEGTALFLTPGGRLRHFWLPRDTVLQGHLVRAQDDGAGSRLHPNGRLLAIWLAQDEEIDGVPCTSSGNVFRMGLGVIHLGTQRMAWFHDNGRLQQAMLSQDVTLQGHGLKKGQVISLTPDGKIDLNAKKLSEW